eukprot:515619-Pelagomonas_calceolata.AAC.4
MGRLMRAGVQEMETSPVMEEEMGRLMRAGVQEMETSSIMARKLNAEKESANCAQHLQKADHPAPAPAPPERLVELPQGVQDDALEVNRDAGQGGLDQESVLHNACRVRKRMRTAV